MPKILKDEWVKCSWCEELINLKEVDRDKRYYFRKSGAIYCSKKCSSNERSERMSKITKERNIKNINKHGNACISDLQTNLQVVLGEKNWILEKFIHVPKNTHPEQTGYRYKADLMHRTLKLIVELDGPAHNKSKQKKHDKIRDEILTSMGYKVLRFSNKEVEDDMSSCIDRIHSEMRKIQTHQF
jgi:hypothetical protein